MFCVNLIVFLILAFVASQIYCAWQLYVLRKRGRDNLIVGEETLQKQEDALTFRVSAMEKEAAEYFFYYDLAKKIAPILDKKELFKVFTEEIKYLGDAEIAAPGEKYPAGGAIFLKTKEDEAETLYLRVKSEKIMKYAPQFTELLELCVDKINLYEKLQQLAIYDSLTEVYNRRYFMMRFSEEFERAKDFNLNMSFLMIDVDDFKKINDIYGHLAGDAILKNIAQIIKENIREIDFIARYGGEEFAVVLLDTDRAGAILVGERICDKVSGKKIKAFDEILNVTISCGTATFPQNTLYADVLLETADRALYKAKQSGKNRTEWF